MIFEYCETCNKVTPGGYFPSATVAIKAFLCNVCFAITYIDIADPRPCDETWKNDIKLRNEAVKLQPSYILKKRGKLKHEVN